MTFLQNPKHKQSLSERKIVPPTEPICLQNLRQIVTLNLKISNLI
ncbi:hypothetical protein CAMRE0001_2944 [Campylobacter rectus RM3267]|uniref:Uncharacterized protein n=1 Tax=Campylobacter rectus RM3267 TaxID=553218 RepID=B9D2A0_CAMRE|nr:hypothetical protein CAMRE0001_2944 [Campylobacter rectus RM3267]